MTVGGRVALVTGGGAGIGAATCERLANAGHAIGVLGPRAENTRAVCEHIKAAGGRAIDLRADVSDRAQLTEAFASLREAFGPAPSIVYLQADICRRELLLEIEVVCAAGAKSP